MCTKIWPGQIFLIVNFVSSHDDHFGLEVGGVVGTHAKKKFSTGLGWGSGVQKCSLHFRFGGGGVESGPECAQARHDTMGECAATAQGVTVQKDCGQGRCRDHNASRDGAMLLLGAEAWEGTDGRTPSKPPLMIQSP